MFEKTCSVIVLISGVRVSLHSTVYLHFDYHNRFNLIVDVASRRIVDVHVIRLLNYCN